MVKRVFDILVSSIGMIMLLPIFILIALIIIIDDGRPIFFRQERIGLDLRPFILYKFRTMRWDNFSSDRQFEPGSQSRITRFGRLLRKSKLDELPQLINVLKNEMSLVGPRPEVRKWVEAFPQQWSDIMKVKPGITDNASILFRNEEKILAQYQNPEIAYKEIILPQKLDIYLHYSRHRTFSGDIKIILNTIISIFK
jgi:lipopolysaccharide/colanic/teichoic acid biosynthesis glycosyltransferase